MEESPKQNIENTPYRSISINTIGSQIQELEQNPSLGQIVYTNLDILARCVDSIFRHNGQPSWVADVRDAEGRPVFTPSEYERIHEAFSVFFPMLYAFFGKEMVTDYSPAVQRGGNNSDPRNQIIQSLQAKVQELEAKAMKPRADVIDLDAMSAMGVDGLYRKVIETLGQFNSSVMNFASKYGILRLEQSYDREFTDPKPFLPLAGVPGLQVISQVPVPMRTIVVFLYTCLDIARVMISILPTDLPFIRKILSITMAIVDILRGDWKKSLLSFSSYFSKDYAILSVIGKVLIDVAGLISPTIQESMTYGLLDVSKSILAGFLLSMFQTFAPGPLRQNLIEQIDTIRREAGDPNPEVTPISSQMIPSFEHIQTLQSAFINPNVICKPVVKTAVRKIVGKPGNENIIMKIALELLRIPVDEEAIEYQCSESTPTPEAPQAPQAPIEQAPKEQTPNSIETNVNPEGEGNNPARPA